MIPKVSNNNIMDVLKWMVRRLDSSRIQFKHSKSESVIEQKFYQSVLGTEMNYKLNFPMLKKVYFQKYIWNKYALQHSKT